MRDIALVVAMADNRVIGRDGGLPWRLPGDLARFKAITMGKPMVMGRKTFASIGRPLPGRETIVVTRDAKWRAAGVHAVASIEAALALADDLARAADATEIAVVGGGEIYAQLLDRAARIYLTEVHARPNGDVRFPVIDPEAWCESAREPQPSDGPERPAHDFVVLERRAN